MSESKTALVVDDSTVARLIIKGLLPAYYRIVEATDGEEGLTRYREARPDILFLDLLLPGMDGVTLLTRIQEFDPNPQVIVVTSNVQRSVKQRLTEMGVLAFIEKPVNRPEAGQAILETLERLEGRSGPVTLTVMQQEALAEVLNISVGRAASALSDLTGSPVQLKAPQVGLYAVDELELRMGQVASGPVTGVHQVFTGAFSGDALLAFPVHLAEKLVHLVIHRLGLQGQLLESDLTTLMEIGNLVINAVLGTFGEMLQTELSFSVPDITVQTLSQVVRSITRHQLMMVQYFLLVQVRFLIDHDAIAGHLLLLIGVDSVELLLEAIRRLIGDALG